MTIEKQIVSLLKMYGGLSLPALYFKIKGEKGTQVQQKVFYNRYINNNELFALGKANSKVIIILKK